MRDATKFYIGGQWVEPCSDDRLDLINPATEEVIGQVANGSTDDVNKAVAAARSAFESYSSFSVAERRQLIASIDELLVKRNDEIAEAIMTEMGAPWKVSLKAQAPLGSQHFSEILRVLEKFPFEERKGSTLVRCEPIGVCALISPWNWPMNQVAAKVAPALAAGCTMVLKPSEFTPLDAVILAEILDEAGVPAGVFNLVHGTGQNIGDSLTSHSDVDMISFTGSTRAGVAITHSAAAGVKRVALELGGKSAGIVLDCADHNKLVRSIVSSSMVNSGQSCNALTRVLIARKDYTSISSAIVEAVDKLTVGLPERDPKLGPLANRQQYERVNEHIQSGLDDGAELLAGGPGRPQGLNRGYFVKPTVFGKVTPEMRIARHEIFGPVLALMIYDSVEEAIEIANNSVYGLSGYVWSTDHDRAVNVASRMRTGMVHINGAALDSSAPFGGYKQSGNGREWGEYGLKEFLEYKSVYGGVSQ